MAKRICIDIRSLENKNSQRGIGYYVYHLAKNILKNDSTNIYYLLVNQKESNAISNQINQDNVHYIQAPLEQERYSKYLLKNHLFLSKLLFANRFDIFLSPDFSPPVIWPKSTKIYCVIHDLIPLLFPEHSNLSRGMKLDFFIKKKIIQNLDRIITISNRSKEDIINYYRIPHDKIHVIYEAADGRFRPIFKDEKKLIQAQFSQGHPYLLYIGDIADSRKNVLFLIKVYKELIRRSMVKSKLLLAGGLGDKNQNYYDILEFIKKNQLENDIIFTGYVKEEIIPKIFGAAEVLLYPSAYEGFGLPVVQSMNCGVPVVAFENSSIKELFTESAVLVPDMDKGVFVNAIARLSNDSFFYNKVRDRGLKKSQAFDWQDSAEQFIELLDFPDHKGL